MRYVSGTILTDEGMIEGHVSFEDGHVVEVGRGLISEAEAVGIVIPTLVNAHTHIADFVVPIDLGMSLEELVAPPNGLKHRMISSAGRHQLQNSMGFLAQFMIRRGVGRFLDFREEGERGAKMIREGCVDGATPFIMGRPTDLNFDRQEMESLLRVVDGVGLSSISDWEREELMAVAELTHARGKMFGLHASERKREDIDIILDSKPDFLVHMTEATDDDLETCADQGVPIVVCPRSNLFFGRMPPIARMLKKGITMALGTDNAMITMPDMLAEMEFTGRLMRFQGVKRLDPVLEMAILNGRKILKLGETIGIQPGSPCDFMVLKPKRGDSVTDLILRSSSEDPLLVCVGERIWR
jgi:cytosine/adenosine deaminase-related metal-dependent hydrolase